MTIGHGNGQDGSGQAGGRRAGADGPGAARLSAIARAQRRRRLVPAGLAVLCAAALGALAFAVVTAPAPPPPPPPPPADALAGLDDATRARLMRPALDLPASFRRVYGGDPGDLCAAIDALGVPMSPWRPDPFVAGAWTCVSDLIAIGRADAADRRSTLFVNLRGQAPGTLNTVRIKLNGDNPATLPAARAALTRILQAVGARYGWPWPQALLDAIAHGQAAEIEHFGLSLRVLPEDPDLAGEGDGTVRLNLILDFPAIDLAAPAEIFAPLAWDRPQRRPRLPDGGARLGTPPFAGAPLRGGGDAGGADPD